MSSFEETTTLTSGPSLGKSRKNRSRANTKVTLTDFNDMDGDWEFMQMESIATTISNGPTELDREVSDSIREEAKKHAHDGTVSAKMYRAAEIYFEATLQEYLNVEQAKFLLFSIRRNFRGKERVEQDVYSTFSQEDVWDDDAGVLFVTSLARDRFGWAVWSNIDFVYRVVLYDGILVLGENQDPAQAAVVQEKFCIGYLDTLPPGFEDRRDLGDFESLQFTHDESPNAPAIDVIFEFYVTEIDTDTGTFSVMTDDPYAGEQIMSARTSHDLEEQVAKRKPRFSAPAHNISKEARERLVSNHPARISNGIDPDDPTGMTRQTSREDGVTVVRIDTFLGDGKGRETSPVPSHREDPGTDLGDRKESSGLPIVRERTDTATTGGYYQDSDASTDIGDEMPQPSSSRLTANTNASRARGKKSKGCVVM